MTLLHRAWTGRGQIVVRITQIDLGNRSLRVGVTFRSGTSTTAAHVSLIFYPGSGLRVSWRDADKGVFTNSSFTNLSEPAWLRLARSGDQFTPAYSTDGATWTTLDAVTATLPDEASVGIFAASNSLTRDRTVVFANLGVTVPNELPGDVNNDGTVDLTDFSLLKGNFGMNDADRGDGDLTGDGAVDLDDFTLLKGYIGAEALAAVALAVESASSDSVSLAALTASFADWELASPLGEII
jgi:hypothetical protein